MSDSASSALPTGRRLPGGRLSVFLVLAMLGSIVLFAVEVTPDHALDHLIAMGLAGLVWISLLVWFTACSGYSLALRRGVLCLAMLGMAGFVVAYRPEFSGEMIPSFRPRWAPRPDQRLASLAVEEQVNWEQPGENDFPRYFAASGQGGVDGVRLARSWDNPAPRLMWRQPIGAGWSAFSAVGEMAVTMEQRGPQELVVCYDTSSGEPQWTHALEVRHETVLGGVGPRGTPTIADGKVYAVGGTAVLRCLDGATGRLDWSVDLVAEFGSTPNEESQIVAWGRANSPWVVDGMVVVPAGGPRNDPTSLAAFDARTGKRIWSSGRDQVSYSSPIVGELAGLRQVVTVNEQSVAGYQLDIGKELWSFAWPGSSSAAANTSQPLILPGDRIAVSKGYAKGGAVWQIQRDGDNWSASPVWENSRVLRTKLTSCIHYQGQLYALSDGILQCVDAANGELNWKGKRFGHGQLLRTHDMLLVVSETGDLTLVACTAERYEELGVMADAVSGKCWNTLCLVGDRLLVRSDVEAACYQLPTASN